MTDGGCELCGEAAHTTAQHRHRNDWRAARDAGRLDPDSREPHLKSTGDVRPPASGWSPSSR